MNQLITKNRHVVKIKIKKPVRLSLLRDCAGTRPRVRPRNLFTADLIPFFEEMADQALIQAYKKGLQALADALAAQAPDSGDALQDWLERVGVPARVPLLSAFQNPDAQTLPTFADRERQAERFWREKWKARTENDAFWWQHLLVLLNEAPNVLTEVLPRLSGDYSPLWLFELRYAQQREFANRTRDFLQFESYLENLLRDQEAEVKRRQEALQHWFAHQEEEALFAPYHELIALHNLLEKGLRTYAAKLTRPDVLEQLPALRSWLSELETEVQAQLRYCADPLRLPAPEMLSESAQPLLFDRIRLFRDVQSTLWEQLKTTPDVRTTLQEWEELENLIVHRVQGRLRAFADIQARYRQVAVPALQTAYQEMFRITEGVTERFLAQLQDLHASLKTPPKAPPKPARGETFSWEDFKKRYETDWRKEMILAQRQKQQQDLKHFRAQFSELLTTSRQEITNILESTREVLTEMVATAQEALARNEAAARADQAQLTSFFQHIRSDIQVLTRRARHSERPFWEDYPALTRLQDIRQATEAHINRLAQPTKAAPPTQVFLFSDPRWTRPLLERAVFAAWVWKKQYGATVYLNGQATGELSKAFLPDQLRWVRTIERSPAPRKSPYYPPTELRVLFTPEAETPDSRPWEKGSEMTFCITPALGNGRVLRLSPRSFWLTGWSAALPDMVLLLRKSREEVVASLYDGS